MCEHVKLKGEVVRHGLPEVLFGGYLVIEIIESVQPLVIGFNGCFDAVTALRSSTPKPHIEQVLAFVFG